MRLDQMHPLDDEFALGGETMYYDRRPSMAKGKHSVELAYENDENSFLYPPILSQEQMEAIASNGLPAALKHGKWKRLYRQARDGNDFQKILQLVDGHPKTVIVARTIKGDLVGGFAEEQWEVRTGFFGQGSTFLFSVETSEPTYSPDVEEPEARDEEPTSPLNAFFSRFLCMCFDERVDEEASVMTASSRQAPAVKIYNWTGKNDYFQICTMSDRMIAFGGGGVDGNFGLCIESETGKGSSGPCETFGNDTLVNDDVFDIADIEVYGISTSFLD